MVLGTVAEMWFFTHKDVSYGKKVGAIIAFWIVVTAIIGLLAVICWAGKIMAGLGACALLELIFIGTGCVWWTVAAKVRDEFQSGIK